jgi:hypothetical protein
MRRNPARWRAATVRPAVTPSCKAVVGAANAPLTAVREPLRTKPLRNPGQESCAGA